MTPFQLTEELVHRVDGHQPGPGRGHEIPLHLFALTRPQQTMVDEHTGQPVTDGALHQRGRHRGVHTTGQPADRVAVADLLAHLLDQRVGDIGRRPGDSDSGELVQEPAEHLLPVRGVHHLRVVLHTGQPTSPVLERRHRCTGAGATTSKPSGAEVTASPWLIHTGCLSGRPDAVRRRRLRARYDRIHWSGMSDRATERLGHGLESVADAEHRNPRSNSPESSCGAPSAYTLDGPPESTMACGSLADLLHGGGMRDHLRIDPGFTDAPGDQLGVLGTEVDNQTRAEAMGMSPMSLVRRIGRPAQQPQVAFR